MTEPGVDAMEPTGETENEWVDHVSEIGDATIFRCGRGTSARTSPASPACFMPYVGGVGAYREICEAVAAQGGELGRGAA